MSRQGARQQRSEAETAPRAERTIEVGWISSESTPGALYVDFEGNSSGPLHARTTIAFDPKTLEEAIRLRQGVILLFERARRDRPIIMGLIQNEQASLFELLLGGSSRDPAGLSSAEPAPRPADRAEAQKPLEARVDGKRVVLEAEREIVLRCGNASITLTRDGKVIVRGAYVETHSRGVNRIKGGAVKIN